MSLIPPFFCLQPHIHKHAEDLLILVVQVLVSLLTDIAAPQCVFEPDLSFSCLSFTINEFGPE